MRPVDRAPVPAVRPDHLRHGVRASAPLHVGPAADARLRNSVVIAGKEFKQKLLDLVGVRFDTKPEELATQYVVEEKLITLAEVYARAKSEGVKLETEAEYIAPQTWPLSDQEARKTVPKEKYRKVPSTPAILNAKLLKEKMQE